MPATPLIIGGASGGTTMPRYSRAWYALAGLVLAWMAAALPAVADSVEVKRNAHVREQPTKASTSLKIATVGMTFEILDDGQKRRGFYHIDLGDGRDGWIYGALVERHADSPVSPALAAGDRVAVHFIDVDQGAAALVEFPCAAVLIDAGGRTDESVDDLLAYLAAFFSRRTDLHNRIETVFVTHTHLDHNRGLRRVAETYEIGGYVDNGEPSGSGRAAARWIRTHANASGAPLRIREIPDAEITAAGVDGLSDSIIDAADCAGTNPTLKILSGRQDDNPGWTDGAFDNGNNKSLVIRIDYGKSSFLFTGDLEEPAIETLVDYYAQTPALDVDVWAVGHHGSANGVTRSLLRAMTPEIAVMSMGDPATHEMWTAWAYGHPRRSAVELIDSLVSGAHAGPANKSVADKVKSFSPYTVVHALYGTGWDGDVTVIGDATGQLTVMLGQ